MYKLFLTLRYLRKGRIAYFAIAAVTLCVAMVLIVMSVMGGFLDMVMDRSRGMLGDIVIDNRNIQGFPLYQEFIDEIRTWPEIAAATPVIYTVGTLHIPSTDQQWMVNVVGIRLDEVYEVNEYKKSLYYETHYPGTTTLAEQTQPLLGLDDENRVVLPEQFREALERSRRDPNTAEDDSAKTELNEWLLRNGFDPIPGVYAINTVDDGEPRPGLIIGRDIVARREKDGTYYRSQAYPRGCMVSVMVVNTEMPGLAEPRRQPFRYADDSRTGIFEIDSRHVYCDFGLLQRLLGMDAAELADGSGTAPPRCSQIQIRTTAGVDAAALTDRLRETYLSLADRPSVNLSPFEHRLVSDTDAVTWQQQQAHVIGPVQKERQLVTILFGIISLVAVVLVMCILYMIALQKTRDIGVIKSIGGSSTGVACIFLCYGAAVGVVGAFMGAVMGYYFVTHINEIQSLLTSINPSWQVWDQSVYSFDRIPSTVRRSEIVQVVVSAIIASMIGSFAAAWRAGSMEPVEALRYE